MIATSSRAEMAWRKATVTECVKEQLIRNVTR